MVGGLVRGALLAVAVVAVAACSGAGAEDPAVAAQAASAAATAPPSAQPEAAAAPTTTAAPAPTTAPPPTTAAPATTAAAPTAPATTTTTTEAPRPGPRVVIETGWSPFASVGGITLVHPANRVERIGFHESNHDGARQLEPLASAAAPVTLESRERDTASRGSADVVADPGGEIRAPVTGTVKRGGTYTLYCHHRDDFVVIAPDANPAWEVKLLHIDGLAVRKGERVTAGETVVAARPTQLPFESQVDELRTADPAWPHVHLEVVDPSIPDRPTKGGGGC